MKGYGVRSLTPAMLCRTPCHYEAQYVMPPSGLARPLDLPRKAVASRHR